MQSSGRVNLGGIDFDGGLVDEVFQTGGRRDKLRHYLGPGFLTRITPALEDYSADLPQGSGVEDAGRVLEAVASLPVKTVGKKEVEETYGRISASDTVERGYAVSGFHPFLGSNAAVGGCLEVSNLLCALYRMRGLPSKFIRNSVHSYVNVFVGGLWHKADAFGDVIRRPSGNEPVFKPMDEVMMRNIMRRRENGWFGQGLDSHDVGIRGIRDFYRYSPKRGK